MLNTSSKLPSIPSTLSSSRSPTSTQLNASRSSTSIPEEIVNNISSNIRNIQSTVNDAAEALSTEEVHEFAEELARTCTASANTGVNTAQLTPDEQQLAQALGEYVENGSTGMLPPGEREILEDIISQAELDPTTPSGRVFALMGLLQTVQASIDAHPVGRFALNAAHATLRSIMTVAGPTMIRLVVGHAIDAALRAHTSEITRTVLSCIFMAIPVIGQVINAVRDESNGTATGYSRATRFMLAGFALTVSGAGYATNNLKNAGMRFAEAILYPVARELLQAIVRMRVTPNTSPSWRSLIPSGIAYAANQLGVSCAWTAWPHEDPVTRGLIVGGVVGRAFVNALGEGGDLVTLPNANHLDAHGVGTQPAMRIEFADPRQEMAGQNFWDTMFSRGNFVGGFGLLYDVLLDVLTKLLGPELANYITEAVAAGATIITYPFWTDQLRTTPPSSTSST